MKKLIILLLLSISLSSCSFQSSQYSFFRGLLSLENNANIPEKNWTADWVGKKIDLFAINAGKQIIFADSNINIFFREERISKIIGLFPRDEIIDIDIDIDIDRVNLKYTMNDKKLSLDSCEERKVIIIKNESKRISQTCFIEETGKSYENQIFFNSSNLLTGLIFKIHPAYPPLELSIKQSIGYNE